MPELVTQLGSPAGDVHGVNGGGVGDQADALVHRLSGHHLESLGRALHVTVGTGLVAVEPDVELEDLRRTSGGDVDTGSCGSAYFLEAERDFESMT